MDIRLVFSALFVVFSVALVSCAVVALRSKRDIGFTLGMMLLSLTPPVIGNLLIVGSTTRLPATLGCYLFNIGIDATTWWQLRFTLEYCKIDLDRRARLCVLALFGIDVVQLALNPLFGHAFTIEEVTLLGSPYFRTVPHVPQYLHRALVYAVLAAAVVILARKMIVSSRLHAMRYAMILATMVVTIGWCTFYVVSRTPLDRSMIGYTFFGLLTFYFALYYKPRRLIDRILVDISSELPDALFLFDDAGECIWANARGLALVEIDEGRLAQASARLAPYLAAAGEVASEDDWWRFVTYGDAQQERYLVLEQKTIRDGRGRVDGSLLSVRDETQEQLDLRHEAYTARHDELTGLYTRPYLYQRIERRLAEAPQGEQWRIVFVNVRNFKLVNDVFGKAFGDEVLRQVGALMRRHIGANGLFGRLAGDTFGLLVPRGIIGEEKANRLLADFTVADGDVSHHVLMHVGLLDVEPGMDDVSLMFDRARMAAASLGDDFHNHVALYDDTIRDQMLWEQKISNELPEALAKGEIRPYLQPIADAAGSVVGAEALVRWHHPSHGFLAPYRFIPVFERNGMIADVDRHIWRSVCELLASWDDDLFVSVNVSPVDFFYMDVAAELRSLVAETGCDPRRLRIEITESAMIADVENMVEFVRSLQGDGFIVEMDDFGSGYSSLNMLGRMPVDVIKVDMVFLRSCEKNPKAQMILKNVVRMISDLEIVPLTEGVETQDQYEALCEMGCVLFQGYYFAKPMPVEDFESAYVTASVA